MILAPSNLQDLCEALARAHSTGEKISAVQMGEFNHILEHTPEDMTATVEAGITLAEFQSRLTQRGQWLPIDPPNPDSLTVRELLAWNRSGPRRLGYGTVRDYLIGVKAVLADGRLIKAGGKVVKNVAGYDLGKLLIGSHDSLGIIVEATFKLNPISEAEEFIQAEFSSIEQADAFIESVLASDLTPTVLDLHNLSPLDSRPSPLDSRPSTLDSRPSTLDSRPSTLLTVVLGFAGAREDVGYQLGRARNLGAKDPSNLAHDGTFWSGEPSGKAKHVSVLPSKLAQTIRELGEITFIARAANGIIWYRGGLEPPRIDLPLDLMERVKDAFDPKHILPELPL